MAYTYDEVKNMTVEDLKDALFDVINEREAYPENSRNKKALRLDSQYLMLDDTLGGLKNLISRIKDHITSDKERFEAFTGMSIGSAEDKEEAEGLLDEALSEYSSNDVTKYLEENGINWIDLICGEYAAA